MPANRNPQHARPTVAKPEDFLMRKMFLAAIATLAVVFAGLTAARAAPYIGDGSSPDWQPAVLQYNTGGG